MVFEKVLRLSQPAAASYGPGTLLNIMQVDTFRFQFCFFHLNFMWSMPVMLSIGVALLYRNLGISAFVPLVVMASMYPLNRFLVRRLMDISRSVSKARDARVKIITEVLHAIRLVKMLAWEEKLVGIAMKKREDEMGKISDQKLFDVYNGLIWQGLPAILPLLTFGSYVLLGGHLDPALVFSSLALLDLVRVPMNLFPQALQVLVQISVGTERIQQLLLAEELQALPNYARLNNKAEPAQKGSVDQAAPSGRPAVLFSDSAFQWTGGTASENCNASSSVPLTQQLRFRQRCGEVCATVNGVRRSAGTPLLEADASTDLELGLAEARKIVPIAPHLKVTPLEIVSGKLVMVAGAVGAGKSTFVAALLNEVPRLSGHVELSGPVAYCAQVPWILHGTIQDNVTVGDEFDEALFNMVTQACALDRDLEELAEGANTVIGERGINLSGGQKARIGLARAVYRYSRTAVYILDDPLSAVDMHVAKHLMEKCLGADGILQSTTRILVTHQLQFKDRADLLMVLKDGKLVQCKPPGDFFNEELTALGLQADAQSKSDEHAMPEPACSEVSDALPPSPLPLWRCTSSSSDMSAVVPQLETACLGWQAEAWPQLQDDGNTGELSMVAAKDSPRKMQQYRSQHPMNHTRSTPLPLQLMRSVSALDALPQESSSPKSPPAALDLLRSTTDPVSSAKLEMMGEPPRSPASAEVEQMHVAEPEEVAPEAVDAVQPTDVVEGQEEREVGALDLSIWCTYARIMGPTMGSCLALAYLGTSFTQLGSTWWLKHWSSENMASSWESLDALAVYAMFALGTVTCLSSRMFFFRRTSLRTSRQLHHKLLWAVLRAPMSWIDMTPSGRIINRFAQDVQKLDMELQGTTSSFVDNILNLIISLAVVGVAVPAVLLVVLPMLYLYNRVQKRFRQTARELQRLASSSRSPIFQSLDEAICGVSTLRAFGLQSFFIERNSNRCGLNTRLDFSIVGCNRWLSTRMKCLGTVPVAGVVLAVLLQKHVSWLSFSISSSMAGLVLRYTLQLTNNLEGLLQGLTNMELCLVALERITTYAQLTPEPWSASQEMWPEEELETDEKPGWPSCGKICFDSVCMRYRNSLPPVLNGISFTVPGGTSVGVVGRTGAGKSSLLQALFRMCPLDGGVISIDGEDIWKMGLRTLRRRLAIIPQDPVGFTGTLRFNLDPFGDYSEADLMAELEKVQLKEFVDAQQNGLNYHLSAGGENLSVGQRQLACAARAFLIKSPILILDEATASVDFKTDTLIQEVLRKEMQTRSLTTVTIAHRINTIISCTNVLVMDKGKNVEFGPPQELAADPSTIFSTFVPASEH
eukprot:TRINITY_DN23780_c0_g1_i1.p1 TRINITY_DN23780_c0_g1~~TRINITY_DN23780_c0_g1_i1.p1  ORF type:complete len:1507 (+),score=289.06 TRINITY_DN23780_c0_g1_i1:550-4521(+)